MAKRRSFNHGSFRSRRRRRSPKGWLARVRPLLLLATLLAAWPTLDPALVEPLGPLASDPELVSARFTRCGRGRGHACVVDGDTFKIGERRIRIIGIDAPEVKGECVAERRLAERATHRLQQLLNQGSFVMTGRVGDMRDRYGRDLRALSRERPDGSVQSIAGDMRTDGLARRYLGFKTDWC